MGGCSLSTGDTGLLSARFIFTRQKWEPGRLSVLTRVLFFIKKKNCSLIFSTE